MFGKIREPVVQGMFYPSNKNNLIKMISAFLLEADPPVQKNKELLGLIVPHAGYVYSGQCAAYAYKLLKAAKFDTIIILGPSHRTELKGASLWAEGSFRTALGDAEIDTESADYLLKNGTDIEFYHLAHLEEHSVEVQIPFLQYILKNDFKLVPIVLGNQTYSYTFKLAETLYELMQKYPKKYLILASSDLSHYHTYDAAKRMDNKTIDLLKKRLIKELAHSIDTGKTEACGIGSILTLLFIAEKYENKFMDILNTVNSGDISGDKSRVVGYMSAALYK